MQERPASRQVSVRKRTPAAFTPAAQRDGQRPRGSPPEAGLTARAPELRRRIVIEGLQPEVDEGRYPARCIVGENVTVEADIYADGHTAIAANLLHRKTGAARWAATPMQPLGNDRWRAAFTTGELAPYEYTIEAWLDPFQTWRDDLVTRTGAGQDVAIDLHIGAGLIEAAARRAPERRAAALRRAAARLTAKGPPSAHVSAAHGRRLAALMRECADKRRAARYRRVLRMAVDIPRAAFSAWYEMFPRSVWSGAGLGPSADRHRARHATLRDCERRLPYIAEMGFDVLYLPPVHPIARTGRKGQNNALKAARGDPGSPWAIGSEAGGHKAIHPDLGTLEDFRRLVARAQTFGIDIALDIAFQTSPDHPYVKEHPQWFRWRPDGAVQYAENPPKKYQDIYPLNFETDDWQALWREMKSIVTFWVQQGVRIFRVDNPHTKPFPFWEWLIAEVKREHPDVIFLSEAFTRPKVMYHLAKLGFTQSYTYFAWRHTKQELTEYFTELTQTPVRAFFRPSVWPNTPDILTEYIQNGGRPALIGRLVLAATLSSSYGIYGPAFELGERTPREPGSEEYLRSEKYEIKRWDIGRADSLREIIARVNRARRENPALQQNRGLRFHRIDNDQLIAYSKETEDAGNVVITIVNLDPNHRQSGWLDLTVDEWGLAPDEDYQVHDVLSDARYPWRGRRNYVELDPHVIPAHIFRLRRRRPPLADWEFD